MKYILMKKGLAIFLVAAVLICSIPMNIQIFAADTESILPTPTVTLDFLPEGIIAEVESVVDTTAVINADPVALYKSLDNGAEGIEVTVESDTAIKLITKYTFSVSDSEPLVFYRYDYYGTNEVLNEAAISEHSGYVFVYSGDITIQGDKDTADAEIPVLRDIPDTSTGVAISSELPEDVTLTVTKKSLVDTELDTVVYPVNGAALFYDVTLYQEDIEYQPENGITITFPETAITDSGFSNGDSYNVYHIHDSNVEKTGPYTYDGGDISVDFDNLSIVGIAEAAETIDMIGQHGEYTLESLDGLPAVIKSDSVLLYDSFESNVYTADVSGVANTEIDVFVKVTFADGFVLYQFAYYGIDTDFNEIAQTYQFISATSITVRSGEEILEEIYWKLLDTVSKEGYEEVRDEYTGALALYTFTNEQQAILDAHYETLPYRDEIVYTPWSGRVGPLVPAVTLISPYSRMSYAFSRLAEDTPNSTSVDNAALHTSKLVSDNGDGTYTITIEAYAEGQVTVTTSKTACDVVLVLDMSSSMKEKFSGNLTREQAIEDATQAFVASIIADAEKNEVDHRVAVVTYNTDVSLKCGLTNVLTDSSTVTNAVSDDSLSTSTGTRSDLGIAEAVDVFENDTLDNVTSTTRQRVVIFFTDGYPSTSGSTNFDGEYAKDAINYANTLKASTASGGYGATVYSVAVLDAADPAGDLAWSGSCGNSVSIGLVNGYLHAISSNYPDATATYSRSNLTIINTSTGTNNDYYLTAEDPDDLNGIFNTVSNTVISGSTSVDLGTDTTVKDIVTPYFTIPEGASGVSTTVADCTGYVGSAYQWGNAYEFDDSTVTVTGNTLDVSGFDFTHNFVAKNGRDENDTSKQGDFYGRKLIISFDISPTLYFLGGNDVPTNNAASGIYAEDGTLYENLTPIPDSVNIPLKKIENIVHDKHVYYTNTTDLTELLDLHVKDTSTNMDIQELANGVNNAYVDLVYSIKVGDVQVATYTIPSGNTWQNGTWETVNSSVYLAKMKITNDTEFSVTCDMVSVNDNTNKSSTDGTATVYVYKPVLTFADSEVYYQEAVNFDYNYISVIWKNGTTIAGSQMEGNAPALVLTYDYESGSIDESGNAAVKHDIPVSVTVTANQEDITDVVSFQHNDCNHQDCGFNSSTANFIVHVLLKETSMTIIKKFPKDADYSIDVKQTFIFTVKGVSGTDTEKIDITVTVHGDGEITITNLPIGEYVVTEHTDWSWRYKPTDGSSKNITLSLTEPNTVTFENTRSEEKWLDGDSYNVNIFNGKAN